MVCTLVCYVIIVYLRSMKANYIVKGHPFPETVFADLTLSCLFLSHSIFINFNCSCSLLGIDIKNMFKNLAVKI